MTKFFGKESKAACRALVAAFVALCTTGIAQAALEITEIMYNPNDDAIWEWIEVRNTGGTAVDLDGYLGFNLGDGALTNPSPTIDSGLSTDTEIPAGGVGIIYDGFDFGFPDQNYDADLVRQAWGIDPNTPVIAADFWPNLSNSTGSQTQSVGFWATLADYQMDLDDPNTGQVVSFANAAFSINYSSGFPVVGGSGGQSITWTGNGSNQDGGNWVKSSDGDSTGAVTSSEVQVTGFINSEDDLGNPGVLPGLGSFGTGLHISEILYNPAGDEPDWEWVEVYNNTGSTIDFANDNGGYVIDDENSVDQSGPNISGSLADGEIGVLFNADAVDPNDFATAWGSTLNLLAVTGWDNMGLNNSSDNVGIWSSYSDYTILPADPNNDPLEHQSHANALVSQKWGIGAFPAEGQGQSIYLAAEGLDPNDGNNWAGSLLGDGISFNATGVADPNGNVTMHAGGDEGSPGFFTVITDPDFDGDMDVDGTDFLIWQRNAGTTGGASNADGDANGDGNVDGDDLAIWEAKYGTVFPLQAAVAAVPEPSSLILCGLALAPWGLRRRRCNF